MASNDFLTFAVQTDANVIPQSTYASLAAQQTGFPSGILYGNQLNKVLRQAAFMASCWGQLIANNGVNASDDGNQSEMVANLAGVIGAAGKNVQVFSASGTWTCPAGVTKARVTVIGGGGGAAGSNASFSGGGGGGGGAAQGIFSVTPGTAYAITIGAGGAGGGAGGNGLSSSFGSLVSATGGAGGSNSPPAGGAGGVGTGGSLNLTGSDGIDGGGSGSGGQGIGGPAPLIGSMTRATATTGKNSGGFGSGGGACYNLTPAAGGAGSSGLVIVEW